MTERSLLSEEDLYLFNEGTHSRLQDKLGAHPRRVESLNDLEDLANLLIGDIRRKGQFIDRRLEIAVVIDVTNDHFRNGSLFERQVRKAHLL